MADAEAPDYSQLYGDMDPARVVAPAPHAAAAEPDPADVAAEYAKLVAKNGAPRAAAGSTRFSPAPNGEIRAIILARPRVF